MQKLKVVVAHRPPFVFVTNNTNTGVPYFSGLLIDLINRILITGNVSYQYDVYLSPSNAGGTLGSNGVWSGVVGELVSQKADVALFPLTRTASRLAVIDATYSYYDAGLALLVGDGQTGPGPLSVLAPFEMTLWVTLLCTIIAVALLFWGLDVYGRWIRNRQFEALRASGALSDKAIARAKKEDGNPVLISFMAAAGAPERPGRNSWGVQVLYVVYCFFCLIVLSSYTANLTSYLAVRRAFVGISGLQDLVRDNSRVGVNPSGSTAAYFATSQDSLATQLQPNVRYCDTPTCVAWVRQGTVRAFVTDQPVLLYLSQQQPCDLAVVGDPFGPGNLVIGLQKDSPLTPLFNAAIQGFSEDGTLSSLRRAWFDGLSQCQASSTGLDSSRLTVSQMLGAFVFLVMGVLVAFVTGTIENLKWCLARAYARSYTESGSSSHNNGGVGGGGRSPSFLPNRNPSDGPPPRSSALLHQASRLRAATWRRLSVGLLGILSPPSTVNMERPGTAAPPAPQLPAATGTDPNGPSTTSLRGGSAFCRGSAEAAAPSICGRTFISTVSAAVSAEATLSTAERSTMSELSADGGGKADASLARDVVLVMQDGAAAAGTGKFVAVGGCGGGSDRDRDSDRGFRQVSRSGGGGSAAEQEAGGGSPRGLRHGGGGGGGSPHGVSPLPLPQLLPMMTSNGGGGKLSGGGSQQQRDSERGLPGQPSWRPGSTNSSDTVAVPSPPPAVALLPPPSSPPAPPPAMPTAPSRLPSPMRSGRIAPSRECSSNGVIRGNDRQPQQTQTQQQWIMAQPTAAAPWAPAEQQPSVAVLTLSSATELTAFSHGDSSDESAGGGGSGGGRGSGPRRTSLSFAATVSPGMRGPAATATATGRV